MNYLDLALGPTPLVFHAVDRCLATQEGITRTALWHLSPRRDGTYLVFYQLVGERVVIEETLVRRDDVLDCDVVAGADDGVQAFIHLVGSASDGRLVEFAHEHALIIDTPITFEDDDMCVRLVGTDRRFRTVLQSLPAGIDFSVRDVGEYEPVSRDRLSRLADRQRDVFETAVEQGYYELPRRTTHQELASTLGCTPRTVDKHLRKAESALIPHLF